MARLSNRPPLDRLRKNLEMQRADSTRRARGGFIRKTYVLPRGDAQSKAREWFAEFPKSAYWTEVESWCEHSGDVIEFTMRRLPSAG